MKFDSQADTEQRIEAIKAEVVACATDHRDLAWKVGSITCSREHGTFYKDKEDGFFEDVEFSAHAEGQLLQRLRIPTGYVHRCPNHLQADNANYWLTHPGERDKDIFARLDGNVVRAIFSTRYKADMDDKHILPVILDHLQKEFPETLHIKTFVKQGDFTILKVLFKDAKTQHEGDLAFAGITIVNSEVGKSSVWIKPIVRNGNEFGAYDFIDASREGSTSFRHTGELKANKIIQALHHAKKVAQVGIYRIFEANTTIVDNPVEDVKTLVKTSDFLTQNLVDIIEEEYQNTVEATKLQVAQSLLKAVSTLPLFKRYTAEKEIGRYLNLFGSTAHRLDQIISDMDQLEE